VSKDFRKKSVELAPSRIRRDPVRAPGPDAAKNYWDPAQWETWVVVAGVVLFALALTFLSVGFSEITSH
jgi:hypothetical protein